MNRVAVAKELIKTAKELLAIHFTMDRSFYIPRNREVKTEEHPELGLVIYTYEQNGAPYGLAFAGKSNKPLWNYRFVNEEQRRRRIEETIDSRKSHQEYKEQLRKERQEYRHTLKEGDILVSSWGYDQTNVDFYQVIAVGEKSVKIREIGSKTVKSAQGADYVVADKDAFKGPPLLRRVGKGDSVTIDRSSSAYKWDGQPKYETSFGWGH
jgi:hypothetical protein